MWNSVSRLKHFWVFILLVCVWGLFNLPVLETVWVHGFDDGTYSHSFLVPFIVLYLVYILDSEQRINFRNSFSWSWALLYVASGLMLWVATWSQVSLLYWLMSQIILIALIFQVFKFNISTFFPAAYLVFIFPFWGAFAVFFQNLSVYMVTLLMSFTNIPVYVESEFVSIPSGIFEIAEGCSGLRYIIVALAISSLYIFLYLRTAKSALILIAFALVGALVTNWIRIVLLIVIGHFTEMESSLMTDHNNFGWYVYIPVAIAQFYLGGKLELFEAKASVSRIKEKKEASEKQPKIALYFAIIGAMVFSSSTAIELVNENNDLQCKSESVEFSPQISQFDHVCVNANEQVIKLDYIFTGKKLDSKATYFLNDMLPVNFQFIKGYKHASWNIKLVESEKGSLHAIAYRYKFNSQYFLHSKDLKKARIMGALSGNTVVEINWRIVNCEINCKANDIARLTE